MDNTEIDKIADAVDQVEQTRAGRLSLWSQLTALSLSAGGAFVAGAMALITPTTWLTAPVKEAWGLAGLIAVLLGAVLAFALRDRQDEIAQARASLRALQRLQTDMTVLESDLKNRRLELEVAQQTLQLAEGEAFQLASLYRALDVGRGAIEGGVTSGKTARQIIRGCLQTMGRDLQISLGFGPEDVWSIVIYKTGQGADGRRTLYPIEDLRSIECDIKDARTWDEGVGVAGMALATNNEKSVADMMADEVQGLMGIPDARPTDINHRSLVAVPVAIHGRAEPWGVVCASVDRPYVFDQDRDAALDAEEPIRGLAGIVALAAAVGLDGETSKPTTDAADAKD